MKGAKKKTIKGSRVKTIVTPIKTMQKRTRETGSRSDWLRLKNIKDEDIDTSEIPVLDNSFWSNAIMGSPLRKQLISLRLDKDIINWFKTNGPNYQTRINQVLRSYVEWNEQPRTSRVAETGPPLKYSKQKKQPTKP